jgi:hypothetical protein
MRRWPVVAVLALAVLALGAPAVNSFFSLNGRWAQDVRVVNGALDVTGQASAGGDPFDMYFFHYLGR